MGRYGQAGAIYSTVLSCRLLASLVDGLDTLYLMGFRGEFAEARDFVAKIDWSTTHGNELVQVFETVIRYVGGLLSAYELSGDPMFVAKSAELVDRLLPAFDTPTGIPYQYVNFTSQVIIHLFYFLSAIHNSVDLLVGKPQSLGFQRVHPALPNSVLSSWNSRGFLKLRVTGSITMLYVYSQSSFQSGRSMCISGSKSL